MTQILFWGKELVAYQANETISAGNLVTFVADNKIGVADATENPIGVALEDGIANEMVTVALPPAEVYLKASANVTHGDAVIPANSGQIQPWDGSSAKFIIGVAKENIASGNSGRVLLL